MPEVPETRHKAVTILVVEDSATQAQKLKESLELKGFSVATAGNGIAGVAAVRTFLRTLIVCDAMVWLRCGVWLAQ